MLVGHFNDGVDEYDAVTGAYIKTYNGGPGVGTQWAGLYAPTGGVYITSWTTNDVREYDANTGAFIRVVTTVDGWHSVGFFSRSRVRVICKLALIVVNGVQPPSLAG